VNLLDLSVTMRDVRHRLFLELARRGSEEAFRRLYAELYDPVCRYIGARVRSTDEAEDLVATVFARFVEGLGGFDAGRGPVTAWVLGMARHAVIDHQRRRAAFGGARQSAASIDDLQDVLAADLPDALGILVRDEEMRAVRSWVRRQDESTRELLDLRFGQGLTSRETAQVMGLTADAVRKRCERALRQMRQELPTVGKGQEEGGAPCMNVE
jgi:RNA polymerase sigma-70 factor (ECF subfamily)